MRSKSLDRIVKLLRLARDKGATQAESENAMLMAQRLMEYEGLSEEQVEHLAEEQEPVCKEVVESTPRFQPWRGMLGVVVAKNFRCEFFLLRQHRSVGMVFLGRAGDVAVAKEVYLAAVEVADRACKLYIVQNTDRLMTMAGVPPGQDRWRNASKLIPHRKAWFEGFVSGLEAKFSEQVKGMALVVVPDAAVKKAREDLKLTKVLSVRGSDDAGARADGFQKGLEFSHKRRIEE